MAKMFRLNDTEEKSLTEISLKVNRELIKMGKMPMKDTEICHLIIEQTLINGEIEVKRDGSLRVISHEFLKDKSY